MKLVLFHFYLNKVEHNYGPNLFLSFRLLCRQYSFPYYSFQSFRCSGHRKCIRIKMLHWIHIMSQKLVHIINNVINDVDQSWVRVTLAPACILQHWHSCLCWCHLFQHRQSASFTLSGGIGRIDPCRNLHLPPQTERSKLCVLFTDAVFPPVACHELVLCAQTM